MNERPYHRKLKDVACGDGGARAFRSVGQHRSQGTSLRWVA
jgi:hypothetical protein